MPDIEPPFDYHGRCVLHGRLDCPPCEVAEAATEPPSISEREHVVIAAALAWDNMREWWNHTEGDTLIDEMAAADAALRAAVAALRKADADV